MSLVDCDQQGVPVFARCGDQRTDERRDMLHLGFPVDLREIEQQRQAMLPGAGRGDRKSCGVEPSAVEDGEVETPRQRDELTLGIDHDLLHVAVRLFEDASQCPALAGPGCALDEQTAIEDLLEIQTDHATEIG